MTSSATFKMGRINPEGANLPSVDQLADGITDTFTLRDEEEDPTTGEELEYLEKGRNVHFETERDAYNFCYFTYVTDTPESIRVRGENNEEQQQSQVVLETADVILFENGQYVFQSRDDIPDAWIPLFIGKRADIDIDGDDFSIYRFGSDQMQSAYDGADEVSVVAFGKSGDEEEETLSDLGQDLQELAEITEGLTFSTGNSDRNLKDSDVVDTAVNNLDIKRLNVKKGDQNVEKLRKSGRIRISWNENDWDDSEVPQNRSQTIRSKVRSYLESFL